MALGTPQVFLAHDASFFVDKRNALAPPVIFSISQHLPSGDPSAAGWQISAEAQGSEADSQLSAGTQESKAAW